MVEDRYVASRSLFLSLLLLFFVHKFFTMTKPSSEDKRSTFLGIEKRYLASFTGLFHGLSSFVALIVGNYIFIQCFMLGNESSLDDDALLPSIFHVATAVSGKYYVLAIMYIAICLQLCILFLCTKSKVTLSRIKTRKFFCGHRNHTDILLEANPILSAFHNNHERKGLDSTTNAKFQSWTRYLRLDFMCILSTHVSASI